MLKNGNHFSLPNLLSELEEIWEKAEAPDVKIDGYEPEHIRHVMATSWAYVSAEEQGSPDDEWEDGTYFGELMTIDGYEKYGFRFVVISDNGDGCINHIYIVKEEEAIDADSYLS